MRRLFCRPQMPGPRQAAAALLLCLLAGVCEATQWQELGTSDQVPTDRVYVDTDSIHQENGYVVALFLTIYDQARTNSHDITMDRYVQKTAFDCTNKGFSTVSTTGYLNGNEVGESSESSDWKHAFKPIPNGAVSKLAFARVCSSPAARSGTPAPPSNSPPH